MFKILFFIFIFFSQINFLSTHLFVFFTPKSILGIHFELLESFLSWILRQPAETSSNSGSFRRSPTVEAHRSPALLHQLCLCRGRMLLVYSWKATVPTDVCRCLICFLCSSFSHSTLCFPCTWRKAASYSASPFLYNCLFIKHTLWCAVSTSLIFLTSKLKISSQIFRLNHTKCVLWGHSPSSLWIYIFSNSILCEEKNKN